MLSKKNFFKDDIKWIDNRIREDISTFSTSLKPLAEYYINKRLIYSVGTDGIIRFDPTSGLPTRNFIPQVVLWLADAFGIEDSNVSKQLALGLVYSSLAFAVLDDTIEQEPQSTSNSVALANMYLSRFLQSFDGIFEISSEFWYYLATSVKEFTLSVCQDFVFKYETHDISYLDPLSESFLFESCKSYSALVLTTLAALAYASNNEDKIPQLTKFWTYYATGHRIYDDLNDLHKDLKMSDYNNSSVLLFALQKSKALKLDEELVWSLLLDKDFIDKIYDTMLSFFKKAKEEALVFNSPFLNSYMNELISSHLKKKDNLLTIRSNFFKDLYRILK